MPVAAQETCFPDSPYSRLSLRALVAQWLEQRTHNPLAVGSNPTEGTILTICNSHLDDIGVQRPSTAFRDLKATAGRTKIGSWRFCDEVTARI